MEYRYATTADLPQLSQLFNNYRVWYQQVPDIAGASAFLLERLQQKQSTIIVAEEEGQLLAFTQLYPIFSSVRLKPALLLNDLFVAATARKRGIAAGLLSKAAEHGRSVNAAWLLLQTNHDNFPAQALYEKNGWKRVKDFFYEFELVKS
jgi:GNAT superfamily N-acetyltransferase